MRPRMILFLVGDDMMWFVGKAGHAARERTDATGQACYKYPLPCSARPSCIRVGPRKVEASDDE